MNQQPTILKTSYMLGPERSMEEFGFPSHPNEFSGAAATCPGHRRIGSAAFTSCTALLVEDTGSGEVTAFHLKSGDHGVISRMQIEEFAELRDHAQGPLRAVFIQGTQGTPLDEMHSCHLFGEAMPRLVSLHTLIKEDLLPGAQWCETVRLPFKCWSFAYDADKHDLHISPNRFIETGLPEYVSYGDPFGRGRKAETPAQQFEQQGADITALQGKGFVRGA